MYGKFYFVGHLGHVTKRNTKKTYEVCFQTQFLHFQKQRNLFGLNCILSIEIDPPPSIYNLILPFFLVLLLPYYSQKSGNQVLSSCVNFS
jgi:hypothetical protein